MTTTETRPTEAEAEAAMQLARANHAAAKSEIETFREMAQAGSPVDTHDYAAARVADELTAIRVAAAEAAHTEASEREAHDRRESWANTVRPAMLALDANTAAKADAFKAAARELVEAARFRESTMQTFFSEAGSVGPSDRVDINQYSGTFVDRYPLKPVGTRLIAEVAGAWGAILTAAGQPGAGEGFDRMARHETGLPREPKAA
jgi:hypothetical protein